MRSHDLPTKPIPIRALRHLLFGSFLLLQAQSNWAQVPTTPKPSHPSKPTIPIRSTTSSTIPTTAAHLLNQLSAAITAERRHEAHALATELHQRWADQDEYTALWLDNPADSAEQNELTLNALLRLHQARPESTAIAFALGRRYALSARWTDAQAAFQSAHALAPNHPDPAFNLALCWEQLGQTVLAKHYYQRALALLNAPHTQPTAISTLHATRVQAQLDRLAKGDTRSSSVIGN